MKKILIEFVDQRVGIMLPIEMAGAAASLVAAGCAMKRDYRSTDVWEPDEKACVLSFIDETTLTPLSEREKALVKAKEEQASQWYQQYQATEAANKRVKELEASLEALKSVTVCQTIDPPPTSFRAPEIDSQDLPFD